MTIVAGIDEAGLGPVLGPMVVSAATFRVPDASAGESLWRLLAGAVTKRPSKRRGAVAVADSKKLYSRQRPNALAQLERGVLAFLAASGEPPNCLRDLLRRVAPSAVEQMTRYPWYDDADLTVPQSVGRTDLALAANSTRLGLARKGIELRSLRSEVLFEGEYNQFVQATRNKATTLFDVSARLLAGLWRSLDGERAVVCIDRHGGRTHYREPLQRVFGRCRLRVLAETEASSSYIISDERRRMELRFAPHSEDAHLPVALASMVSKYLRELFMLLFNRFWGRQVEGLKPTAGYYVDGRRFWREIAPAVKRLGFEENLLYRCR